MIYRKNNTEPWKHSLDPRPRPSSCEIILTLWMITLFFEEIRQVKYEIKLPSFLNQIKKTSQ